MHSTTRSRLSSRSSRRSTACTPRFNSVWNACTNGLAVPASLWPSWFSARESPAAQPDVQPAAQTGVLFHDAQLSGVLSLSSKRSLFPVGPLRRLHSELCRRLCSSPRNQPCSMLCSELRQAGKRRGSAPQLLQDGYAGKCTERKLLPLFHALRAL